MAYWANRQCFADIQEAIAAFMPEAIHSERERGHAPNAAENAQN